MRRNRVKLNEENHAISQISRDLQEKKKHQRRYKRKKNLANALKVFFVAALFFAFYLFDSSQYSRIQTVKVSGNRSFSDSEILTALNIEKGNRIYLTHGFLKEAKGRKIEGLESLDINVYYTKGYVSIDVVEVPLVAYQVEPELKVYYADGSSKIIDAAQLDLVIGLPLLVGYTDETISLKMLKALGELDFETISAISEIHINPETYDPLAMKLYMVDKYLVYVSIETLPMMYLYATLLPEANDGNKCIVFNEYGPDNENGSASIRACSDEEY